MNQNAHPVSNTEPSAGVLIVDDDPRSLEILEVNLENEGYTVHKANNGEQGFEKLQKYKNDISVVLLDRMMPKMNGIQLIEKIKADTSVADIPVIMQTGAVLPTQIVEGIAAGAYYYLTKPYTRDALLSIVRTAISSYAETSALRKDLITYKTQLHLIKESFFEASTLEDIHNLTTFLANFYPEPERVVNGISELLLNAVEHGNLGITYSEKSQLMLQNAWLAEVQQRLLLPENKNKKVRVHYQRHTSNITLNIKDEGNGFDWQDYLEIDSTRATDNHGRGIALAKMMSFDDIQFQGSGNELVCTVLL